MLKCRQYRDLELASMAAALMTFAANRVDKRKYI